MKEMEFDWSNQLIEKFSIERMEDGDSRESIFMGFTEDEIVFLDGIFKSLSELSELMGDEPSMELHAMQVRMEETVMEFYESEEEGEE